MIEAEMSQLSQSRAVFLEQAEPGEVRWQLAAAGAAAAQQGPQQLLEAERRYHAAVAAFGTCAEARHQLRVLTGDAPTYPPYIITLPFACCADRRVSRLPLLPVQECL